MALDVWFYVDERRRIIKCVENDGWAFLRDGPQRTKSVVSVEYVKQNYPQYYENYIKDELTKKE
jgi:hypothetical protein